MRYMMIVTYDGKNYSGFQKQQNAITIQEKLEQAIKTLTKQEVSTVASGRTDAKVSAYFQPVHFDLNSQIDCNKFLYSINGILPSDIKVLKVFETNLHARFSVKRKTYVYKMYISEIEHPLKTDRLRISLTLDLHLMKKFLKLLIGSHDFAGFRASGSETESSIRTIYSAKLKRKGNDIDFEITGNGFLYKMVRNIVGTMLKVGEHKIDFKNLKSHIFHDFTATNTAKPEFLYLKAVKYE